jgi:hypothetical protein
MLKPLTLSVCLAVALGACSLGVAGGHGTYGTSQCPTPQCGPSEQCAPSAQCGQTCAPRKHCFANMCGNFLNKCKPKPKCYTYEWVLKKKHCGGGWFGGHCSGACGGAPACDTCGVWPSSQWPSGQGYGGIYGSGQAMTYGAGQMGSGQMGSGQMGAGQMAPGAMAPAPTAAPAGEEAPPAPEMKEEKTPAPPAPSTPSAMQGGLLNLTPAGN